MSAVGINGRNRQQLRVAHQIKIGPAISWQSASWAFAIVPRGKQVNDTFAVAAMIGAITGRRAHDGILIYAADSAIDLSAPAIILNINAAVRSAATERILLICQQYSAILIEYLEARHFDFRRNANAALAIDRFGDIAFKHFVPDIQSIIEHRNRDAFAADSLFPHRQYIEINTRCTIKSRARRANLPGIIQMPLILKERVLRK